MDMDSRRAVSCCSNRNKFVWKNHQKLGIKREIIRAFYAPKF
jgi:hypothetical protein